ncbi:PP2C family protein-serine/threonine phosphatase [Thiohalophilus thiocyanatoxydans]|uniref:Serine/threonine protein phosphatase PrpC n=1 Tax=Thiohalophilus thiocyanatoxydans TaxID=381308 RepID=A0A4R8IX14_9GAMM|nr:PP2C family serine/threonine-protein phosphatase [Thiohalophilus thiocyanatoxydans]TDY04060.1 serine/threonine protein phosphatase PrpC [Thiohalophilus thiocyanatoxydans]
MQVEIGRTSRLGNREINQDRLGAFVSEQGALLVLGDGLGGRPGGDVAAQALVDTIEAELALHPLPAEDPPRFLRELLRRAHRAVLLSGQEQAPPLAPGTTAVLSLIQNGQAWWAHVGDSRVYLFRDGLPIYRTRDHSYVEQLYQAGRIPLSKRQGHPMRNFVTQCIGLNPDEPQVTISNSIALQEGDVLLLCSDGFWEPLDDALIGSGLASSDLRDSIEKLAERAERASYPYSDNTSVVAARILSLQQPQPRPRQTSQRQSNVNTLDGAIEEIERAIKTYEDEMK